MARLGDICTIVSGSTPKSNVPEYWDGTIKWITPAELEQGTYIINDSVRHITELGVAKTGLKPFPQGTVILSSRAPIGKTAIAGCEMYCNQGFKNLICSDKINPRYLYWFLTCNTEYLNSLGRGATFKEISKEIVANIEIPLPSVEHQVAIAEKFEKLSELIALRKEQLAKLDQLVKSRFIELFGDPVKNDMGWECKTLNDVCDGIGDGLHGTPEYDDDGDYPFINGNNLIDGEIVITPATKMVSEDTYKKHLIDISPNAILISINGTLGKLAFYNGEQVMLGKSACYCNLKPSVNKVFVYGVMKSDAFAEFLDNSSTKSTIKNVGLKAMREYKLILPPTELQEQFAAFVEQTDKSKLAIQQSLDKLETLKKSLMQKYFG